MKKAKFYKKRTKYLEEYAGIYFLNITWKYIILYYVTISSN